MSAAAAIANGFAAAELPAVAAVFDGCIGVSA
jgi:hypothetical protein